MTCLEIRNAKYRAAANQPRSVSSGKSIPCRRQPRATVRVSGARQCKARRSSVPRVYRNAPSARNRRCAGCPLTETCPAGNPEGDGCADNHSAKRKSRCLGALRKLDHLDLHAADLGRRHLERPQAGREAVLRTWLAAHSPGAHLSMASKRKICELSEPGSMARATHSSSCKSISASISITAPNGLLKYQK